MKRLTFLLLLAFCFSLSAEAQIEGHLSKMKWLQGSWVGMAGNAPFNEGWRFLNDSTLVNFAIEINGTDTLIRESGVLMMRNKEITLRNGKVQWKGTRLTGNELVLKNDSLPYSNTIIWLCTRDDHWFTILEHPKSTVYYDIVRDPLLDQKLETYLSQRQKNKAD